LEQLSALLLELKFFILDHLFAQFLDHRPPPW
jgi:hypothetical protein